MTFHDVQFPADISYGSSGGPAYLTDVVSTLSGHEHRNINWAQARATYNVSHGVKTQMQLDALIAFFRARKGRAHSFRFKDWTDYQVVAQTIATGTGSQTAFQLIKYYSSGAEIESRTITKPVAATVKIYFGSTLQTSGWTLNATTGVVTFASPPAGGVVVKVDFEFDVPARFDTDQLSASLDTYGVRSWRDIPIVEVRN